MPGNPVQLYLSKFQLQPGGYAALYKTMSEAFGTNLPLWDQYWHFWYGLVHGDLGVSIYDFPGRVTTLIFDAIPYTLALLVPAIVLSYLLGNRLGAAAPGASPWTIRCSRSATYSRPSPTRGSRWRFRSCSARSGTCSRLRGV
jgi:ABC-type dipeptide/oligopeptide/nickel transport systems, permease components